MEIKLIHKIVTKVCVAVIVACLKVFNEPVAIHCAAAKYFAKMFVRLRDSKILCCIVV